MKIESAKLLHSLQPQRLAVGMQLAKVQYLVQLQGDENAPHFLQGQEPLQDGRAYRAVDGTYYYRPELQVAHREIEPTGPDVRFLKDADGAVWLYFELDERVPAGMPNGARPLAVRVEEVALNWQGPSGAGSRVFPEPTMAMDEDSGGFTIRVGAKLAPEEVNTIHQALSDRSANAHVAVKLSYGYWVDEPAPGESSGGAASGGSRSGAAAQPVIAMSALRPTLFSVARTLATESNQPASGSSSSTRGSTGASPTTSSPSSAPKSNEPKSVARSAISRVAAVSSPSNAVAAAASAVAAATAGTQPSRSVAVSNAAAISKLLVADKAWAAKVLAQAEERKQNKNFKTATITRKVGFYFDPSLAMNRPIYAALLADETIGETWINTGFGWIRKAPFPNTVYRLPDEIRLAYHTSLGAPYMIPALYRDAEGEPRVRVTLGAAPWHDPGELVRLRDYLHRSTAGLLAAPHVVVGGYEKARLTLTGAFPEEIQSLGGDGVEVSLEGGFQLTLDLSLEFYRFLCELLTGPVGLTGEVKVSLRTNVPGGNGRGGGSGGDGGDGSPREETSLVERIVPVRLKLGDISSLPVQVEIDTEVVSPKEFRIVNAAGAAMRIGDCVPRLLQYDPNSVVPIEVLEATAQSTFPATLDAGGAMTVGVAPKGNGANEAIWNAVLVELLGQSLIQDPKDILERIHEVAPESSLTWQIEAECPLFRQNPLPERYSNLYRIEVQVSRPGYAAQQLILGPDRPVAKVTMQRSLREIISEDAQAVATFTYRVRNVYFDRLGAWSEERTGEGSTIFVFPNPVDEP